MAEKDDDDAVAAAIMHLYRVAQKLAHFLYAL